MTHPDVTYPPLDVPKPVAEGIWIVDSGPLVAFGLPLPVRMTVIRLAGGGLLLHSPTCFSFALRAALAELGRIEHLIAPNSAHWMFLKEWQRQLPHVTTWAAPGLRHRGAVRRAGVTLDRDLGPEAPADWAGEIEQVIVPGGLGFAEVALFHRASRTLILTDLVLNLEPRKLPPLLRPVARLIGITAPDGRAPVYLRAVVRLGGAASKAAGARLVALEPVRVVFAHGAWFQADGAARLRRSLRWLIRRS